MKVKIVRFYCGAMAVLTGLAVALLWGCGNRPTATVTGLGLRDIDNSAAGFHGYYVVDGITNRVQGTMPTNFVFAGRTLAFELIRDHASAHGFELAVLTSERMERTAHSQYGIRGHMYFNKDGSSAWLSEPFADGP